MFIIPTLEVGAYRIHVRRHVLHVLSHPVTSNSELSLGQKLHTEKGNFDLDNHFDFDLIG